MVGHVGQPNASRSCPVAKVIGVVGPHAASYTLDVFASLELRPQECAEKIGREKARTNVHPGVFVYLPSKETAPVRPFFAKYFGPFHVTGVVNQQGASLAATDVLRLMKTQGCQRPERAQLASPILAEKTVCVIFHHRHAALRGPAQNHIHFAADTG